jgi:hypothetical protein
MPHPIEASTLRILDVDGKTVGTGFLVALNLVVTCAHVVKDAGQTIDEMAGGKIKVQFTGQNEKIDALVLPEYWTNVENGDIAILKLDHVPDTIPVIALGLAAECQPRSVFRSFGYATAADVQGIHVNGTIDGYISEHKLLQMQSPQANNGISGAPVFDEQQCIGVGMITKGDTGIQRNRNTTFATPSEIIRQACPLLELAKPFLPLDAIIEIFSRDYVQQTECDVTRRTLENVISNLQPSARNRHLEYPLKDKIQTCLSELGAFRKICRFRNPETDQQRKQIKEKLIVILRDASKL